VAQPGRKIQTSSNPGYGAAWEPCPIRAHGPEEGSAAMSEETGHFLLEVAEAWEEAGIVGVVGVFFGVGLMSRALALLVGSLVSQRVLPDCAAHYACGPESGRIVGWCL